MNKLSISDVKNISFLQFAEYKLDELTELTNNQFITPVDFVNQLPKADNLDDLLSLCFRYLNTINLSLLNSVSKTCVGILSSKAHDYSDRNNRYSNFEFIYRYLYDKYSFSSHITVEIAFDSLIAVKIARLTELIGNNKTPKNESVLDSIIDLINYRLLKEGFRLGLK